MRPCSQERAKKEKVARLDAACNASVDAQIAMRKVGWCMLTLSDPG